jgi:tetratricopeptide (TPR) repeat protein
MSLLVWAALLGGASADEPQLAPVRTTNLAEVLAPVERLAGIASPSERDRAEFAAAVERLAKQFPDAPASVFWRAEQADRDRRKGEAIRLWTQVLESGASPTDEAGKALRARAARRLAYVKLEAFETFKAEKLAKQAIELAPLEPQGYYCLLDVSLRTGKLDAALAAARSAAESMGDRAPDVRTAYHDLLAKIGDWTALRADLTRRPPAARRPEDDLHFAARLAEVDGDQVGAYLTHFLAYYNGPADRQTVQRSREYVQKFRNADPATLPAELKYIAPLEGMIDYPSAYGEAAELARKMPEGTKDPGRFIGEYLRARALANQRDPDTLARFRKLAISRPDFVPGLVGLAEAIEVGEPKSAEASEWFAKARALQPNNWKVRELFRMGASFQPAARGAKCVAVEPGSAWGRFGLKPGDEILKLDEKDIGEMGIAERMLFVRLFQGGPVSLRDGKGNVVSRELELMLFAY